MTGDVQEWRALMNKFSADSLLMRPKSLISLSYSSWVCHGCRQLRRQAEKNVQRRHASQLSDRHKLPDLPARTRFAPSPTGFLHLGSLRTALFNYLIAKATNGQFLLRIEDTDTKRTIPGAEERICTDLAWAGLHWDEGPQVGGPFGPYKQSERTSTYQEHAKRLLDEGHAYRCFCTSERLNELSQHRAKLGLPTDYDRNCASISKEESDDRAHKGDSFTIRLKIPAFYPEYNDLVYGRVGKKQRAGSLRKHGETVYEDPILLKSDGMPTYHLANVVDDHLMEITHVVRAAEWMPSTPKHLALYQAFGWKPPAFAHVGLLQDGQGNKLSKRNADIDLESYRDKGIFPEALVNFCALLGWSHTRGDDFMRMRDLIDNFSLKFTKGNTVVTFKKLDYLQKQHGRGFVEEQGDAYEKILTDILDHLATRVAADSNWDLFDGRDNRALVAAILIIDAKKSGYQSPAKFLDAHKAFFTRHIERQNRQTIDPEVLVELQDRLSSISAHEWGKDTIQKAVDAVVEKNMAGVSASPQPEADDASPEQNLRNQIAKYLRWAVFSQAGPPVVDSLAFLGRETSLSRLTEAKLLT